MTFKSVSAVIAVVIGLALVSGCGADAGTPTAPPSSSTSSTAAPVAATTSAPTKLPAKTDFAIGVTILSKKCFGTAGCNLTYRIDPSYTKTSLGKTAPAQITYQVLGGSDGPQINSFTMGSDGVASYKQEESIRTAKSADTLTVEVLEVLPR
jgi:hypothetical protein